MEFKDHKESQEMYLKAINKLRKNQLFVRAVDICEETGYKRSSVSRAVNQLEEGGYIRRNKDKYITMTEKGIKATEYVEERYNVCFALLSAMGLNRKEAEKISCELEHIIDEDVYQKLRKCLYKYQLSKI